MCSFNFTVVFVYFDLINALLRYALMNENF
jgi:hypothetical protein